MLLFEKILVRILNFFIILIELTKFVCFVRLKINIFEKIFKILLNIKLSFLSLKGIMPSMKLYIFYYFITQVVKCVRVLSDDNDAAFLVLINTLHLVEHSLRFVQQTNRIKTY